MTVKPEKFKACLLQLQEKAKLVQNAAMWTMQAEFRADPVFVGPIVAADIIVAGFKFASGRFCRMTQAIADGESASFKFEKFSWGRAVEAFAAWAATVEQ